jgi:1,4-alpha-glucan branching enzyme
MLKEYAVIRRQQKGDQTRLTFTLPHDAQLGAVSVVGDFNDWTPDVHRMTPRTNGLRSVAVQAPVGALLEFRYLGEDGHWFDDPDVDLRREGNGVIRCA